jgi:cytoskeletal protein CcmA (bactofilin family)
MDEEIMAKNSSKKNISIVDRGLTIEGSVSCNGQLIIKGVVKGTLEGDHVVIAEDGAVHADATVSVITIGGLFDGTLRVTQKLVILATGLCQGKIVCNDLTVEPGGILNGEVECS